MPSEYFIGDDGEVMEFDWKDQVVWRMGENREENLWFRHNDRLAEDGSSAHTQPSTTEPESESTPAPPAKTREKRRIDEALLD